MQKIHCHTHATTHSREWPGELHDESRLWAAGLSLPPEPICAEHPAMVPACGLIAERPAPVVLLLFAAVGQIAGGPFVYLPLPSPSFWLSRTPQSLHSRVARSLASLSYFLFLSFLRQGYIDNA